jgi:hypothetical protein
MQQELQPGVRFRSLVRAFSGFLKFVSLISISEYLLGGYEDAAVDELLSGPKLKRPSLGHWNEFLREILQFHIRNGSEPRVLGLLDFYFAGDRRKPSSNVAAIERFITLRNEYVHPDIWPSETTASRLYEENISLLDGLYRNAGFLTEYRFFFQQGGKRLLCHGPDLTAFQQGRSQQGDPEGFFLEKEGEAPLAFMAFLLFDEAEDSADATETLSKDIMLYESRTAKWIKYLRGNNLRYRHEDAFIPTNDVLSRLTKRLAQNDANAAWLLPAEQLRKPRWEDFHKHCKVAALRLVGFHITEKKYNPSFYVARGSIESAFDSFLNGDEPLCLLVGNSGAGKTNLLCHLTMELVASGHAVLHYYGRNYDGGPLLSAIAADLVSDEKDLLPYLAGLNGSSETAGGKKMVLFFDAINEYTDALSLFHNIVELEQGTDLERAGRGEERRDAAEHGDQQIRAEDKLRPPTVERPAERLDGDVRHGEEESGGQAQQQPELIAGAVGAARDDEPCTDADEARLEGDHRRCGELGALLTRARVAGAGEEGEPRGGQPDARPLAPAEPEAEEALAEDAQYHQPAREHGLDERQSRQGERRDVQRVGERGDEIADRPPLLPEEAGDALERPADVDVRGGDRAAVAQEEADVRRQGRHRRERQPDGQAHLVPPVIPSLSPERGTPTAGWRVTSFT